MHFPPNFYSLETPQLEALYSALEQLLENIKTLIETRQREQKRAVDRREWRAKLLCAAQLVDLHRRDGRTLDEATRIVTQVTGFQRENLLAALPLTSDQAKRQRNDAIKRLARSGWTNRQLAAKFELSEKWIGKIVKDDWNAAQPAKIARGKPAP